MTKRASGEREMISIERLMKVDLLQGIAEGELKSIVHFFEEEDVGAGVTLCEEDTRAKRLYILEHGRVSISSKRGRKYYIDTPGKTLGWSFLVPPFLYTASVVTMIPSRFLMIKSSQFYEAIHMEPKIQIKVLSNLAQVITSRLRRT